MNSFTTEYLHRWSQLHGNAVPSRIVRGWLVVAAALARPLVNLRVSPHAVTLGGLILAVVAWWFAPHPAVAALIVLSLIFDGLDGAVAIMSDRVTALGGVLDSTVDRVGEAWWAGALYLSGADIRIVIAAWSLAIVQEYARARSLSLHPEGQVTASVAERPVRALLIAAAIATASLGWSVTAWASAWLILQAVGLVQVFFANRYLLR